MVIRIVGQSRGAGDFLQYGDCANRQHNFFWRPEYDGFCVEVDDQTVISDIFKTQWTNRLMPYMVEPVQTGAPAKSSRGLFHVEQSRASAFKIPPYVAPETYANYPVSDLLLLFKDCGIVPTGDEEDPDNLKAQLGRYYEGRAWAAEDLRRLRAENIALKAQTTAARRGRPPRKPREAVAA